MKLAWAVLLGAGVALSACSTDDANDERATQLPACWSLDAGVLHTEFACPAERPDWEGQPCDCYDGDGGPVFECTYTNCTTGNIDRATCSNGMWKLRNFMIDAQCKQSSVTGPSATRLPP